MQVVVVIVCGQRYAVETSGVVEVVPVVEARALPKAPEWVRGFMDFRGRIVPLLDARRLIGGPVPPPQRANRILVVRLDGELLGLLVDGVDAVGTFERAAHPGLALDETPYLGAVGRIGGETVQRLLLDRLLAPEHRAVLFERSAEGGA